MKKILSIILTLIISTALFTSCGKEDTSSTPDEATESTDIFASAPAATTALDAAIADEGLTVNEDGEIVDEKGNKVKTNEDGKIEVKTADGKTVEVDAEDIKASNEVLEENKAYEEAQKNSSNSFGSNNNSSTSKSTTTSSKASAANTGSSSTSKTGTSSKSGSASSKSNTTSSSTTSKSSTTSSKPSGSTTSKPSGSTSTSSSAQSSSSSKTYHEAVYKYIEHPAETKEVWVVDKEAYTYEEPIYETQRRSICNDCGADLTGWSGPDKAEHLDSHIDEGGKGSYSGKYIQVQVGTKTVEVPEEGHYETKVVKEAWTEKVLVKEAGWY